MDEVITDDELREEEELLEFWEENGEDYKISSEQVVQDESQIPTFQNKDEQDSYKNELEISHNTLNDFDTTSPASLSTSNYVKNNDSYNLAKLSQLTENPNDVLPSILSQSEAVQSCSQISEELVYSATQEAIAPTDPLSNEPGQKLTVEGQPNSSQMQEYNGCNFLANSESNNRMEIKRDPGTFGNLHGRGIGIGRGRRGRKRGRGRASATARRAASRGVRYLPVNYAGRGRKRSAGRPSRWALRARSEVVHEGINKSTTQGLIGWPGEYTREKGQIGNESIKEQSGLSTDVNNYPIFKKKESDKYENSEKFGMSENEKMRRLLEPGDSFQHSPTSVSPVSLSEVSHHTMGVPKSHFPSKFGSSNPMSIAQKFNLPHHHKYSPMYPHSKDNLNLSIEHSRSFSSHNSGLTATSSADSAFLNSGAASGIVPLNFPFTETGGMIPLSSGKRGQKQIKRGDILKFSSLNLIPGKPTKWQKVYKQFGHMKLKVWEAIPDSCDKIFTFMQSALASGEALGSGVRKSSRNIRTQFSSN